MTDDTTATDTGSVSAIVAGPDDHGLGEELAALGVTVRRIDGPVTAKTLEAAGIDDVTYLVLTDVEEATGIAVAKELNPATTAVTYAERSLPEFVAGVSDLAIDPSLIGPAMVAEELTNERLDG